MTAVLIDPDFPVPAHAVIDVTIVGDGRGNLRTMAQAKCLSCGLVVDPTTFHGEYWWCEKRAGMCIRHIKPPSVWARVCNVARLWRGICALKIEKKGMGRLHKRTGGEV